MNQTNINNIYQNSSIYTSSPVKLVTMLYDGAIRFLNQAKVIIEKKENKPNISWIEESHINFLKANKIIFHLLSNLNLKDGGEISSNLKKIYFFLIEKITDMDVTKTTTDMDVVLDILSSLRSAWEEVDKKYKIEKSKAYPQVNNIKNFKELQM